MNIPAPTPPADNRLDYWRNVARSAEQDLERLRAGVYAAFNKAIADRRSTDGDGAILEDLISELARLAIQPANPHQRAQVAYNAVAGRFPELDK